MHLMKISTCSIITARSKHTTQKETIFKLFKGAKMQQLAGNTFHNEEQLAQQG